MQRANLDEEKVKAWAENVEEMDKVLREDDASNQPVITSSDRDKKKKNKQKSDNSTRNISKFSNITENDLF